MTETATVQQNTILEDLGIYGWNKEEPAILAAIASKTPILLVGAHGTAKSLLLERLAQALNLQYRHYNASILNFDDLVGFPVPEDGKITYLRTPLDAWDAQAIFVDEISRCRVDMQNRLFPLIHEKKLQGKKLHALDYCWSAMNPPSSDYIGAQSLDPAFADRFHWIIQVPDICNIDDQIRIIEGNPLSTRASSRLWAAVKDTRSKIHTITQSFCTVLPRFFQVLRTNLDRAGLPLSLRRAGIMYRNALNLIATGRYTSIYDACYNVVRYSLPQNTEKDFQSATVLKACNTAKYLLSFQWDPTLKKLLIEKDPIKRTLIALSSQNDGIVTATLLDIHSSLEPAKRIAYSTRLFPILVEKYPELPAIIFENLSLDIQKMQTLKRSVERLPTHGSRYKLANNIAKITSTFTDSEVWIEAVLWLAFREEFLHNISDVIEFCRNIQCSFQEQQ